MADDDEDEMRALRKTSAYAHQSSVLGKRSTGGKGKQQDDDGDGEPEVEYVAEPLDADQRVLQSMLPGGFGKKKAGREAEMLELLNQTKRGAKPAPAPASASAVPQVKSEFKTPARPQSGDDDDEFVGPPRPTGNEVQSDSDDEDDAPGPKPPMSTTDLYAADFPISHEIVLGGHTKPVSALALDPSGSRLLTGGMDYNIRMWDFAGMDASLKSFRSIEPAEGQPIHQLDYTSSGDQFAVSTGSNQARLFDRDGREKAEFVKGDMYLSDLTHTKGHVAKITSLQFDPVAKNMLMTAGADGTVRLWDIANTRSQKTVIKVRNVRNTRGNVTAAHYSPDGKLVAAASYDGSLSVYETNGPHHRPSHHVQVAHQPMSETSSVRIAQDGVTMLTRGGDDTLKVWDLRAITQPLKEHTDLLNLFSFSDAIFSPNDRFYLVGTSVKKNQAAAKLIFYDKSELKPVKQISMPSSVIRLLWHPKINQLVVGCGDNGTRVLYDPDRSSKGALLTLVRRQRKVDPSDFDLGVEGPVLLPNEILKEETDWQKKKREKARYDPVKSKKLAAPGAEGPQLRNSLATHLIRQYLPKINPDEDPREALIKQDAAAKANPKFFGTAYKDTQPEAIFENEPEQQEEEKNPMSAVPGYKRPKLDK